MSGERKFKQHVVLLLFVAITIGIFYFSWIPDSELTSEKYLPLWLRDWSNSYFNLRTAVPFIPFGFLLATGLFVKSKKNGFNFWFKNLCIATFVVCIAEGGQFFILNRHPDEIDVLFAILGSQVGFVLFYFFNRLKENSTD